MWQQLRQLSCEAKSPAAVSCSQNMFDRPRVQCGFNGEPNLPTPSKCSADRKQAHPCLPSASTVPLDAAAQTWPSDLPLVVAKLPKLNSLKVRKGAGLSTRQARSLAQLCWALSCRACCLSPHVCSNRQPLFMLLTALLLSLVLLTPTGVDTAHQACACRASSSSSTSSKWRPQQRCLISTRGCCCAGGCCILHAAVLHALDLHACGCGGHHV